MKRFLSLFLCALLLLSGVTLTSQAAALDLGQKGSISLTLTHDKKPVPGGKLTVYHVAAIAQADGLISYQPTEDFPVFSGAGDITSPALAKELAQYASVHKPAGKVVPISLNGRAEARELVPGVYLVVQTEPAPGYSAIAPFLVTVPIQTENGYDYSVDASPKVGVEPEPTKPQETTEPLSLTAQSPPSPQAAPGCLRPV